VCQDPSIFVIVDFVKPTGSQLQGLQLAPLAVRSTLTLRRLNNDQAGLFTGRGVNFVKHLAFTAGSGSRRFIDLHRLAQVDQSRFPFFDARWRGVNLSRFTICRTELDGA
jgi:hypothetical protein